MGDVFIDEAQGGDGPLGGRPNLAKQRFIFLIKKKKNKQNAHEGEGNTKI